MMWWGNDWSWSAWLAMSVTMVVFWGVLIWVVAHFVQTNLPSRRRPEDVLADRYASGEIDEDEYQRRRDVLNPRR